MAATVSAIAQSLVSAVFQETGMCWKSLAGEHAGSSVSSFSSRQREPLPSFDLPPVEPLSDHELASAALTVCRALQGLGTLQPAAAPPGSLFQRRVWAALLTLPLGHTCTYSELAARIGASPAWSRAVAQACAANRIALVIPCHRVVPAHGGPGGYRWGERWKSALLNAERTLAGLP